MKRFVFPIFAILFFSLLLQEVAAQEMRVREPIGTPTKVRQEAREEFLEAREGVVEAKREMLEKREELVEIAKEEKEEFQSKRLEKMSEVARQVKILQEERGDDKSGIGLKVREIARNQVEAQEKISNKLAEMEKRKIWVKKMLGYNKEAVSSIQEEIAANRARAEELLKLQEESTDQEEIAEIETAITALTEQNAYLQESVRTEMQNQGVFGWFRGFFKRD